MSSEQDFLWVRTAFRRLLKDSSPHVAKWASEELALAWNVATPEVQARVIKELQSDLAKDTANDA